MVSNKKSRSDEVDRDNKLSPIGKLLEVQEELELVNEEASEKVLDIEREYNEKRNPIYEKRKEIIDSIPNFWLTAFLSHPRLKKMLSEEDHEIFAYLESIDVSNDVRKGYSIAFNFRPNPFFENTVLTKTVKYLDEEGKMPMGPIGTIINWKEGKGPVDGSEKVGNKRPLLGDSFFKWFSTEIPAKVPHGEVAELIKEELWPNPLEYLNIDADEDSEEDEDTEGEYDDDEEEDDKDDEDGSEPDV